MPDASKPGQQMGKRQWGLIYDPKGHPSGFNNIPTPIGPLPFLPLGICHVIAFWGAYTPLKLFWGAYTPLNRLDDVTTHMVFIQLRGSHQLVASRAVETQCYPASTDCDTMEISQALFTRASLTFQTGTWRSFAVLISVLQGAGEMGATVQPLPSPRPNEECRQRGENRPSHYECMERNRPKHAPNVEKKVEFL